MALSAAMVELTETWGVPVDELRSRALERYVELLLSWNARINLTAARTPVEVVSQHFPDAFALAAALEDEARVVDVGSGGGLPAVPLAVLRPALHLQLLEPIAKKAAFLRTAVRELDLRARVSVDVQRAEALVDAGAPPFDVAISRATLPPAEWVALAVRLVRPGGRIFVLASHDIPFDRPDVQVRSRRPYADGRRWLLELARRST